MYFTATLPETLTTFSGHFTAERRGNILKSKEMDSLALSGTCCRGGVCSGRRYCSDTEPGTAGCWPSIEISVAFSSCRQLDDQVSFHLCGKRVSFKRKLICQKTFAVVFCCAVKSDAFERGSSFLLSLQQTSIRGQSALFRRAIDAPQWLKQMTRTSLCCPGAI